MSPIKQVGEFMSTFGQPVRREPIERLDEDEAILRIRLIAEELSELAEAIGFTIRFDLFDGKVGRHTKVDKVAALDALTDLRYVIYGAYHTLGLAGKADDAFDEVHKSNMTKGEICGYCDGSGSDETGEYGTGVMTCQRCRGYGRIANFRSDGKIIKPSTYRRPNLEKLFQ